MMKVHYAQGVPPSPPSRRHHTRALPRAYHYKQLGTRLWNTLGSSLADSNVSLPWEEECGRMGSEDQDGGTEVGGLVKNKEGGEPIFGKWDYTVKPTGKARGTPFSPLKQVQCCRQQAGRPCVQLYFHQAPRKAHRQLGCSVGSQCKRAADSSNLFIPVMEHEQSVQGLASTNVHCHRNSLTNLKVS